MDTNETNTATAATTTTGQAAPVAFTISEPQGDAYVPGAELTSESEAIQTNALNSLQQAFTSMTEGVPETNIINDWPTDEAGDVEFSSALDFHIVQRTSGTYRGSDGQPNFHIVHCFTTPSVQAVMNDDKGRDFAETALISAFKRRLAAIMGSFIKNGEYATPTSLREWIAGREAGASENATRGNAKLFNAIAGDLALALRKGVKGAKVAKADMRGLFASREAMLDKFNLHQQPEVEETLAARLFDHAEKLMLAFAEKDNRAKLEAGEAAPWPTDDEGAPTRDSLSFYFRLLDTWKAERDEATADAPEVDLSSLTF